MNFPNLGKLRFQRQIVLPTGVTIFLLLALLLLGAYNYLGWRERVRTDLTVTQVGNAWGKLRDENQHLLDWFAREAMADPALQRAMAAGDRKALLALAEPRYRKLHAEFGISHWYFISPDRRVLLRVHDPAQGGDEIRRRTVLDAEHTGKSASGLELGMTGTLTLRHVIPWYVGRTLIGYLEMGIEVDWFAQRIKQLLSVDVVGAVHKRYTTEAAFAAGKRAFGFPGNWQDLPDIAVVSQTVDAFPSALRDPWRQLAEGGYPGIFEVRAPGHIWSAGFLPVADVEGRPVASLAILREVGWEQAARDRQLLMAGGLGLVLGTLLLLGVALRTRRIEGRLMVAYEAVWETEQRFEHFASATSDWWFWEMDADLRFSYFSPNAASAIGRPIDSMLGRRRMEVASGMDTEAREKWFRHLGDLEQQQPFHQFEYRIRLPDGGLRWVSISGVPIHGGGGEFLGYRGTGTNISERKQAEESLAESEQRLRTSEEHYRLLLQHSPLGILHYDQDLVITYCNTRFSDILHAPLEQLIGLDMHRLRDPRPLPAFRAALAGEESCYEGAYQTTLSGREVWVFMASAPFVDAAGRITGGIGIVEDITVRHANEQELEHHRHHLEDMVAERTRELEAAEADTRLILESSADGLYGLDTAGRVSFINPAACRMLGYTAECLEGKSFHDLVHHTRANGEHCPAEACPVIVAMREGRPIAVRDDVYWHADGHGIPVIYSSHPMIRGGKVVGVVVSFMDVTGRQALEQAREAARVEALRLARARSDFLANMSHEIRTPLNGVLGLAQIGFRDSEGRTARDTFARILESGKLLLGVINDILDFSKIDSGKLQVESVPVGLGRVLEQAVELMAERARAKGIELGLRREDGLPPCCLSDPLRLTQVLVNLLSNAIKFTERGAVTLEAGRQDDTLVLRVRDSGIGMSEEQVRRLFRPFEQADTSITRRFGGTGLGLSISKHIVDLLGGEIRVDSRVGAGSCFEVRLPLVVVEAGAMPVPTVAAPPTGPRLSGISILAAEDNDVNQMVLEELLRDEGAQLVLAGNGREAVDMLVERGRDAFDIVLMDIQMPEMDGYEATRRILELAPDMPVVGQTAHTMAEERAKCVAVGMVDHVAKPIDLDLLVQVILRHARPRK